MERAALLVLVALVLLSPWPFGSASATASLTVTVVALLSSLALVMGLARRGRPSPCPRIIWPSLAFVTLGMAQLVPLPRGFHEALAPGSAKVWYPAEPAAAGTLGPGPHPVSIYPRATRRAVALTVGLLGLALLAGPALAGRRAAVVSVLFVGGGALVLTVYALVARVSFGNRLYGTLVVPTVAPFGPFVSKNHFAGYVEMACLLVLGLAVGWASETRPERGVMAWIESRRAGRVMLAFGAATVLAIGVLVSLSRGGALSLLGGMLVFLFLALRVRTGPARRLSLISTLGALAVFAFSLLLLLPARGRERLQALPLAADEVAGAFRLRVWRDALPLVGASPLVGSGLGAFGDAFPRFKSANGELRVDNAENDYLQVLAETGWLGLAAVAAGLILAVRDLVAGLRAQPDRVLRGLGLGALGGLAAIAAHSAFDFNLRIPSNALMAVFLLALATGTSGLPRAAPSRTLAAWAGGLAVALALLAPDPRLAPSAPIVWPTGLGGLRLARVEETLRRSLKGRPADAESWVALGWLRSLQGSPREGEALARYGASLDPRRQTLVEAAAVIAGGPPRGGRH